MIEETKDTKTFGINIRILGNEIFAINISAGNDANNWITIGLITTFGFLSLVGAYGAKIVELYKTLLG
jgi:hypothetical protein